MRVGYIVYNDTTECEFVLVNEVLGKVYQLDFSNPPVNIVVGVTPRVVGWNGVVIEPHATYDEVDPDTLDLLVVPGGQASRTVRYDSAFIKWLRRWDRAKPIASCCSGALILAEAGILKGRRATTHTLAMDQLAEYPDVKIVKERVVDDGGVITAGGIMAAFDLGLYLAEKLWGARARAAIAHQDEYRDLQARDDLSALRAEMDGWYSGGHLPVHRRPADAVDKTVLSGGPAPGGVRA